MSNKFRVTFGHGVVVVPNEKIRAAVEAALMDMDISGTASVEMREFDGYIQYSTDGKTWTNVIALSDLKGDPGEPGSDASVTADSIRNALGYTPADANNGGGTASSITLFAGKTASFYGDSLTEVNYHYTKGYYKWITDILGLSSYNNYGVGGYKVSDVINKVNAVTDDADIIFVMIGVNDVQFNVPLGSFAEMKTGTVYGNLNTLCQNLREKYPLVPLVFITPAEQTRYPSTTGVSMYDVAKAVREVCFKNSVVCYDNYTISGIYPVNLNYWTTDKCHWNDKAHEMVGKNIASFVADTFHYLPESGSVGKTINSITAVFNQGSAVIYDTDSLDVLKRYLTVTANYSDGTNTVVTGYVLSGTLREGTRTITVTYSSKITTFTVTVTKSDNNGTDDPSDEPVDNSEYIGKKLTMTGYNNSIFDLTAIVAVDTDFIAGSVISFNVRGANASNLKGGTSSSFSVFEDSTGVCSNGKSGSAISNPTTVTSAVSDSNIFTANGEYTLKQTPSTQYVKIPANVYPVNSGNASSFVFEEITVTVNGAEKKILAVGGFFANETYALQDLEDNGELSLLYSLAETKTFNGTSDYIDTGVPLLAEGRDFTICIDSDFSSNNRTDNCVFCCMQTWGAYPGMMLGFANTGKYRLVQQAVEYAQLPAGRTKMVITGVGGGIEKVLYTESGTVKQYAMNVAYKKHDGNLCIGAGLKQDGTYSFFWNGTMYDFKIYSGVMSEDEITSYLQS